MLTQTQKIELLDLLMSEYCWDYSSACSFLEDTPFDLVLTLVSQISKRKIKDIRINAFFTAIGTGAILSGEKDALKKVLDDTECEDEPMEEISAASAKGTLKTMWVSMGRKPEDFEEAFAKGKIEF